MDKKALGWLLVPAVVGCNMSDGFNSGPMGGDVPVEGPSGEAPTGTRWEEVEVEDGCGRTTVAFVLADEVCGGTDDPAYLEGFHAPIFRDAAKIGTELFVVDASHVWVLDAADPTAVDRDALRTGAGRPLAVATHGDDLVLASADSGLVLVDVSTPTAPVVVDAVPTPGPALDVTVQGDVAVVAAGDAGLAVYDLSTTPPSLVRTIAVPGWAAAVTVSGGLAYVAACDALVVVDLATGVVLGAGWMDGAVRDGRLVAPAKDVVVQGTLAYVAAGRFGAVVVDVADPSAPIVLGNCTLPTELSFYASGVKLAPQGLVVAGGEWGVLSVVDPATACTTAVEPTLYAAPPSSGGECTDTPPWELVDVDLWAPPPPGQDPVQVVVDGATVYAMGDATRVGMRSVDVHALDDLGALSRVGRYEEPRLVAAIAARGGRVGVAGPGAALFRADDVELLVREDATLPAGSEGVGFLADGRAVVATRGGVFIETATAPTAGGPDAPVEDDAAGGDWPALGALGGDAWPTNLVVHGDAVVVPGRTGVAVIDPTTGATTTRSAAREAALPPAAAATDDGVVLAAPEWEAAELITETGAAPLPAHGVFDAEQILRVEEWRTGLPRRVLAAGARGVVEVATLGGRAGMVIHAPTGTTAPIALPPGRYVAAAVSSGGERVFLIAADRGTYRSALVTIDVDAEAAVAIEAFTGVATSVAVDGDRLYVGDGDRGIRVYSAAATAPLHLGTIDLARADVGGAP